MTAILAGLAFGLVGSGHCAAMCGPLVVLAAPARGAIGEHGAVARRTLTRHTALYHLGRMVTYLALGAAAGVAGGSLARVGLGRTLAVAAGVALVGQALLATRLGSAGLGGRWIGAVVTRALGHTGVWMRTHPVQGPVVFGMLNGLLPCGLLYAALTAALGMGDAGQALLFMGAFAVGTTPALAAIGLAGGALRAHVPPALRRAAPVALAIVGVLLILRGVGAPHGDPGMHASTAPTLHDAHSHPR